jgi:hypothetical protein
LFPKISPSPKSPPFPPLLTDKTLTSGRIFAYKQIITPTLSTEYDQQNGIKQNLHPQANGHLRHQCRQNKTSPRSAEALPLSNISCKAKALKTRTWRLEINYIFPSKDLTWKTVKATEA